MTSGRIDVHSHLLPGIDDGCKNVEESIACARLLVAEGYTHSFCTPHIWPSLPENTIPNIAGHVERLQRSLDEAGVALRLIPGGELNLRADTIETRHDDLVTYAWRRKFVLFDIWAQTLPDFFEPSVRWFQSLGADVILAHPERMRAVQAQPELADYFDALGLMLQGNLQCLADPPHTPTYQVGRKFLTDGRYFLLGSDLHNLDTLPHRMNGLRHAIELVGEAEVDRLTRENPAQLLPPK
jgi:protein-tyrosine phosphatase